MFGKTHSDETKTKMRQAQISHQISVLDLETNKTTVYESMRVAAKSLNISQAAISKWFIRDQQKPCKGRYIFKKL
jgi:hypothetical protein